ncbi:hypothetical protein NEHOM01_0698 [Nematocida homosporus]|uniref:uncharacterized protein n=1 Tax=Nematocida homosporus TaxID=1912981 RepID=UPI00221FC38A|nr:uncharacterized protein NEHOM01_0698 [Nematocida homosporus]KAI5185240.1 hypothetical protein NEHOM01_0698 [Nematocida homosporus]
MYLALALVLVFTFIFGLISIFLFRRPAKIRQVLLMGERGTGKTRLFLALSQKESSHARTLPTLEESAEKLSNTLIILDRPGDAPDHVHQLSSLSSSDIILFFFHHPASQPPRRTSAKIITIYTGTAKDITADYHFDPAQGIPAKTLAQLTKDLKI